MSIEEKREQILEELRYIDDPYERFSYVIDRGKEHPLLEEKFKNDTFRIDGCMSQLWVVPEFHDGLCHYRADSDSSITKGIAALLCDLYSGHSPEEVLRVDPGFLKEVGITQHLSPNRRNGLTRVAERIQGFARLYLNNATEGGDAHEEAARARA